ncbi:hypothetical protein CKM354_000990300 [Cercospora kikuchii]|uniref:Velvet domain-containing protein n=1 Tax=Cercospora kikuchii TaxID=84275 RepID=A0A9P3CQG8_9PEZI|nr:uncharacterized protein CKM354_000990300 [Cercospora kikuchii]GIZ46791.1 hypothetical protein CKM354_000990300 [Cercospora kikuchii]
MERPTIIPVDNETKSSISRTTAEGRVLTYEMTVLQQPVRARACGQGAKSSADRRPVDLPPIVELRIYEGSGRERADDITFTMHANYFLFATLEAARPIAHGRVSADRHTPPVLTGTPVAGMVYLDRPDPAGYFIFPDLSVRHEGNYRLSFSLYEELKNVKDEDKMSEEPKAAGEGAPVVNHRLEVKSEPFQVFSAKKFPGLTESTALSRMVAEQGCRVRIRRDVRMRRRDQKNSAKDWDEYEDETAAARARMSSTPESQSQPHPGMMHTPHSYMDPIPRPRSTSNTSHQSLAQPISRRPSAQDMASAYQTTQYGNAPQPPQPAFNQTAQYGPSPTQSYQQGPYVQQAPPMQPPPPQYQQGYAAPPAPSPVSASQPGYYGYAPAPPQMSAPPQASYDPAVQQQHRGSIDYAAHAQSDSRRYSVQQPALPPPPQPQATLAQQPQHSSYPPQMSSQHQNYQQPPSSQAQQSGHSHSSSMDMYNNSRPLQPQPMQPQSRSTASGTPISGRAFDLPPLQTSSNMLASNKLEASSPSSAAPSHSYFSATQTPVDTTHKRSYGHVFSEKYQDQPLRQGARPGASASDYSLVAGSSLSAADDDDTSGELDPDTLSMHYRRADGRAIRRALPGHA